MRRIKCIQFSALSPTDIAGVAETELWARELYSFAEGKRTAVAHGALDARLGPSESKSECSTCRKKLIDCPGHFGYLKLALPLLHVGYFRNIIQVLQAICKTCSRVLLPDDDETETSDSTYQTYLVRLRAPNLDHLARARLTHAVNQLCRKVHRCPRCNAPNGTVKKCGTLRIVHEPFSERTKHAERTEYLSTFATALAHATSDSAPLLQRIQDDLDPLRILRILDAVVPADLPLLGIDPRFGHPRDYIWTHFPVPPGCIRPSVVQDQTRSNEDDLTMRISEIIYCNYAIHRSLAEGMPLATIMEQWEFLQLSAALYINSEMPGVPLGTGPVRKGRGLSQRLKGKQGRFRGNLSGKRVDFSGRTVISPDPNLRVDQVAVPERVAKILTYPERVTDGNINLLRRLVLNGPDVHPGANYILESKTGFRKYLRFGNRQNAALQLRVGDIVERHVLDGDIVLFNRQPSLHKLSIMSHYAKIRPWRTFRFNECVCTPYNADFDGDEMNLHLPQTEEARAEAQELMGVRHNLVTPRNGEPIIAATQDFITAAYLLSLKDTFFSRRDFAQCLYYMGEEYFDLPKPCVMKPFEMWSGKQVLSCLLRPSKKTSPVKVNLDVKTRSYVRCARPDLCPYDGWLHVRNSEVMCGVWDKSVVGDGNKSSIFYVILRDFGSSYAAAAMSRLAKLCARWLGTRGFSIGVQDVEPGVALTKRKDELIMAGYDACDNLISESQQGKLENQPGCDAAQTLEAHISGVLSKIRDDAGQTCMTELSKHNAPLIMSVCGSKGSKINVCQMVACVGQQIISGSRIPDGFDERSLPHFSKASKIPQAKGFVRNSFYTGLSPTEFFFHAVSGREGLVDTAVKTAETGYMQRRLMKALEDLSTLYDRTVRSSSGGVVQFVYGDDGLDPANIEGSNQPVEFSRNLAHALAATENKGDLGLTPTQLEQELENVNTKTWAHCSEMFINSLHEFVKTNVISKVAEIQGEYSIESAKKGALRNPADAIFSVTKNQLQHFFQICLKKYMRALIEPGTGVGAIGAQSIGEPGTQMTLKTFHFAGVASMNVTLGVPRIKEIINAAKAISTPITTARLLSPNSETAARIVKGRIERTVVGDIARFIDLVFSPDGSHLFIALDMKLISKLALEIDVYSVADAILGTKKPKINPSQVQAQHPDQIRVFSNSLQELMTLKLHLKNVLVRGYDRVSRAVISDSAGKLDLLVEGYGLRKVMNTDGVRGTETTSNHVMEVEAVLGIEAARNTIVNEVQYTMGKHGMTIDPRHVMLLADVMSYKGEVLGITRFGVSRMKDSVLMLASFEKTTDHLFDAAYYGRKDPIEGVSECIIMGQPMSIGTGAFKIMHDFRVTPDKPRPLIFEEAMYEGQVPQDLSMVLPSSYALRVTS